jgi:hypothetical protein
MPLVVDKSNISTIPNWNHESTEPSLGGWERVSLPLEVERELDRIANLPANWDGDGIAAVSAFTVERTKYVLRMFFKYGGRHLAIPFTGPAHDGRMILEWDTDRGQELIVDVPASKDAPLRFLLVEPTPSGPEMEIESEISDEWSIQAIVHRLSGSQLTASSLDRDVTADSIPRNDS